jgi:hypothetical protein
LLLADELVEFFERLVEGILLPRITSRRTVCERVGPLAFRALAAARATRVLAV